MQSNPLPVAPPFTPTSPAASSAPTPSKPPSTAGLSIAAIGAFGFVFAFLAAASAKGPRELGTAGYLMLIGGVLYTIGCLMFPAKEPRALRVLGGIAMLVGLAAASDGGNLQAMGAGMIGFAVAVCVTKHTPIVGRIVGGIAAVLVIVALNAKGREARDAASTTLYAFAALGTIDAIGLLVRASAIGKRTPAVAK